MPLLGKAAVAMWWDMAPDHRAELEDWHSHEHFPERMAIPGFLRGSRWTSADDGDGFFVIYELDEYATLTSPHYHARLNAPTPWSTRMMPHHRNMVRSQCRVVASYGGGIARSLATTRFSPRIGESEALRARLDDVLRKLVPLPGMTGGHLLQTETPDSPTTKEQRIRGGGDQVADWILLVSGYDGDALAAMMSSHLGTAALVDKGAQSEQLRGLYALAYAATPRDF